MCMSYLFLLRTTLCPKGDIPHYSSSKSFLIKSHGNFSACLPLPKMKQALPTREHTHSQHGKNRIGRNRTSKANSSPSPQSSPRASCSKIPSSLESCHAVPIPALPPFTPTLGARHKELLLFYCTEIGASISTSVTSLSAG